MKTRPIAEIDVDEAFDKALVYDKYSMRCDEVTTVLEAALRYASETMMDAIGKLALMVRDRPEKLHKAEEAGYRLTLVTGVRESINLIMTKDGEPGGKLIEVRFKPVLTETGKTVVSDIEKLSEIEMEQLGLNKSQKLMIRIGVGDKNKVPPAQKALNEYLSSGRGYRRPERGDKVDMVMGTMLDLSTPGNKSVPAENDKWEAVQMKELVSDNTSTKLKSDRNIWWKGIDFQMKKPTIMNEEEPEFSSLSERNSGWFHKTLSDITDILCLTNLDRMVRERNTQSSNTPWWTSGVANYPLLEEAGYAAVMSSGGLFDEKVVQRITDFSRNIAAIDLDRRLDVFLNAIGLMVANGHISSDNQFICNDLRDRAYVTEHDDGHDVHIRNESGQYLLSINHDGHHVISVHARTKNGKDVGRFVTDNGVLVNDYQAGPEQEEIVYNARNVRDMNGIIHSLESIACVLEDEYAVEASPSP